MSNWTTIGNPGHEPAAVVGPRGLVTPRNRSWSLDAWIMPEGGALLTTETEPATRVRQRLQDRLPVVATAFEERTLRLSTEAWSLVDANGREWVVVQAVVFNISEEPAQGRFFFAVRPIAVAAAGAIQSINFAANSFTVNNQPAVWLQSPPTAGWDCLPTADGTALSFESLANHSAVSDEAGACLGLAGYEYLIEPWEEAEFIAFLPIDPTSSWPDAPEQPYELLKGAATRRWQQILAGGTQLSFPDLLLSESWDANRAHIIVLTANASAPIAPETAPLIAAALALARGGSRAIPPALVASEAAAPGQAGLLTAAGDAWDLYASISRVNALVRERSLDAWTLITQLLRLASPTFAWPEQIDKQTGAGLGLGHSPVVTAAWLRLLRDLLLFEDNNTLVIGAGLPPDWFVRSSEILAAKLPTSKGALDLTLRWTTAEITLDLTASSAAPQNYEWLLPWPAIVEYNGQQTPAEPIDDGRSRIILPAGFARAKARPV